jgi:hypothetical protein
MVRQRPLAGPELPPVIVFLPSREGTQVRDITIRFSGHRVAVLGQAVTRGWVNPPEEIRAALEAAYPGTNQVSAGLDIPQLVVHDVLGTIEEVLQDLMHHLYLAYPRHSNVHFWLARTPRLNEEPWVMEQELERQIRLSPNQVLLTGIFHGVIKEFRDTGRLPEEHFQAGYIQHGASRTYLVERLTGEQSSSTFTSCRLRYANGTFTLVIRYAEHYHRFSAATGENAVQVLVDSGPEQEISDRSRLEHLIRQAFTAYHSVLIGLDPALNLPADPSPEGSSS